MEKQGKIVLVLGATGLIGIELVEQLRPRKSRGIPAAGIAAAPIALANRGLRGVQSGKLQGG